MLVMFCWQYIFFMWYTLYKKKSKNLLQLHFDYIYICTIYGVVDNLITIYPSDNPIPTRRMQYGRATLVDKSKLCHQYKNVVSDLIPNVIFRFFKKKLITLQLVWRPALTLKPSLLDIYVFIGLITRIFIEYYIL